MAALREPATNIERIFVYWLDAIRRGDIALIAEHLAPDVVHQGVRTDLICHDRAEVLSNVARTAGQLPTVEAVELVAAGDHVVLSVRAEGMGEPTVADGPRRGGASIVFTLRDGKIVHIHDYRSRDEAFAAAGAADFRWA
jgi:ketosteroid isomerase-like protein